MEKTKNQLTGLSQKYVKSIEKQYILSQDTDYGTVYHLKKDRSPFCVNNCRTGKTLRDAIIYELSDGIESPNRTPWAIVLKDGVSEIDALLGLGILRKEPQGLEIISEYNTALIAKEHKLDYYTIFHNIVSMEYGQKNEHYTDSNWRHEHIKKFYDYPEYGVVLVYEGKYRTWQGELQWRETWNLYPAKTA